ncbi:MAG: response regulator [Candidatus Woesearchaeota archaeon]
MGKKVLIIDDEYTIRELVALSLEPDYEVMKAEDGAKGLELVKKQKPDLIILDIMMPVVDGYEVSRRLKANKETAKIPIIMLTAKHQIEDLKKAIAADTDEFITKPFEPDLIKKRVDEYFSNGKKKQGRKFFRFGKSIHYIKS